MSRAGAGGPWRRPPGAFPAGTPSAGTLLVAEIGGNHGGDAALAGAMVEAAAACGAGAVKFQAYRTRALLHPGSPYWAELAAEELPFPELARLAGLARRLGLAFGLTVFCPDSLALAAECRADFVKISSGDLTHRPLLAAAAALGRPLIVSTGASGEAEVRSALAPLPPETTVLQCTSLYPCPDELIHLAVAARWRSGGLRAGLSDHSGALSSAASLAAVSLGAAVVERHFTIDRALPGGDNAMSAGPELMGALAEAVRAAAAGAPGPGAPDAADAPGPGGPGGPNWSNAPNWPNGPNGQTPRAPFWGSPVKSVQPGEAPGLIRRAAVAAADLKPGQTAAPPNVEWLRPPAALPGPALGPDRQGPAVLARPVPKGGVVLLSDLARA